MRSGFELMLSATTWESILGSYERASLAVDDRVGKLVKKRVAMGLKNEQLRKLPWERHVARRREPVAVEIRRGIESGELDPSLDVEAMFDLINGLYYYQFVVPAPSVGDEAATRLRLRNAVKLVWEGALRR
ncbi:TetR-like C-terminal domain-containing protein [Arthrobacter sp. M4]|uniref:TetR-like C-terminal domain-containing protein n=1 Tax=Arthrobacter sp. M4 TaxID=218160 RepID=UPI001CDD0ED5|nr:TetR-like C-terminal domain-containing protein [Arthrobacter sp. M4]MCA4133992.1 TetR/AcrR family transcriptional regulator C-terminal ligand-binding domain-containing protein [Arthrobacter sp. M4]